MEMVVKSHVEHPWGNGFRIQEVFGHLDHIQQQSVLDLWASEGVVPPDEARRRVAEVACLILDRAGRLCGVTTAYIGALSSADRPWYLMRMFIAKSARNNIGLPSRADRITRDLLRRHVAESGQDVQGVAVVTENPGLWKKGMHRHLTNNGWTYVAKLASGQEVWVVRFEGGSDHV
jgi:hypothetical protein